MTTPHAPRDLIRMLPKKKRIFKWVIYQNHILSRIKSRLFRIYWSQTILVCTPSNLMYYYYTFIIFFLVPNVHIYIYIYFPCIKLTYIYLCALLPTGRILGRVFLGSALSPGQK
jgi:hypothetical protein